MSSAPGLSSALIVCTAIPATWFGAVLTPAASSLVPVTQTDTVARPLGFIFGELAPEFREVGVAVVLADSDNSFKSHTKSTGLNSYNHVRFSEHEAKLGTPWS